MNKEVNNSLDVLIERRKILSADLEILNSEIKEHPDFKLKIKPVVTRHLIFLSIAYSFTALFTVWAFNCIFINTAQSSYISFTVGAVLLLPVLVSGVYVVNAKIILDKIERCEFYR